MLPALGHIRRVQLWERVAAELRRAIVLGELGPGAHLIEANVAARMEVSRGPVREALKQLEREALVQAKSNGRTLVIGFPAASIDQLYNARVCLESHALRLAATRVTQDDVLRLQEILNTAESARGEQRLSLVNELDISFHRSFLVIGGNQVLLRLWETLSPQIQTLLEITNIVNTHTQSIADKHQRILNALADQHADQAVAYLTSHLDEARDVLLKRMAEVIRPSGSATATGPLSINS